MGRLEDESEEAKAVDFLARTVHEPIEYIETDRVDTEGNKIVLTKSTLGQIGYITFNK